MTARSEGAETPSRTEALARAAASVFAREGFHGATVAEIARTAGVATGTFYLYYPSKEDCLLALIARFYEEVLAEVAAARRAAGGTLAKLEASVRAVLSAFGNRPDLTTVVLLRTGGSTTTVEASLHRITGELWRLLSADLSEGMAEGSVAPGDARLRARLVMGAMSDALLYGLREAPLTAAGNDEVTRFIMGAVSIPVTASTT